MKLFLVAFLVGLLATSVLSASSVYDPSTVEPNETELVEAGILPGYEGETPDVDYDQYQYEKKRSDEVEGDYVRDEAFDCELTDETGRPPQPKPEEITKVCESGKQAISNEAAKGGVDLTSEDASCTRQPHPFAYFVNKLIWVPYLKCCPRVWHYGCRHINARLPCFVNFYKNVREWCCPLYPSPSIARCLCDKCAVQTRQCIHLGKCHKRYSRRNFVAVCYRFGWRYLRYFSKWIPSSCYCGV